ncbi:MAG: purine-nucleoside phosphorylase [Longimicrobiales bacterium]
MTEPPLEAAARFLEARLPRRPAVGIILGSGLGGIAEALEERQIVHFADVPHFGGSTVPGHEGKVVFGKLEGVSCVVLQGRRHVYEGYSAEDVALPARVLIRLGIRLLIVTNAAGGIDPAFRAGDLMIMDDHINLLWRNPLTGPVKTGEARFPDLSAPYDPELQRIAEEVALERGIRVVRGVYSAVTGPSYETPAEIRMLARLGAQAVGMSTIPETLVARAAGVRVVGVALITNAASGIGRDPLTHDHVIDAAARAAGEFERLIRGVLARLAQDAFFTDRR